VDRASRPLGPGESAHFPRDVVHGTYNAGDETLVFLAILSPAIFCRRFCAANSENGST
jgi:quercetin dioxygenase-like cupin family protein